MHRPPCVFRVGMIPYLEPPAWHLGPLTVHAFGILAALGVWVGAKLAARAATRYAGLDPGPLERAVPWALLGGVLGGHLLHVLGYHPELLSSEGPLVLLKLWDGQSSTGGALGGLAGFAWSFRRQGVLLRNYLDALALGVAPGWAVARLGCFMAHDHPGRLTDFPLAVAFPLGARHDLGLYDALVLAAIALVLTLVARLRPPAGTLMGLLAIGYGGARFFLDFLRATDVAFADGRWLGLTPAQYLMVAAFLAGVGLLVRARGQPRVVAPAAA